MRGKAGNRIVGLLLKLGAFLQRAGDRIAGESGLTQQQFVVLMEIGERGPLSHTGICSGLLLEKSNVSKIIKKLAKERLVVCRPLPADRRVMMLSIAPKGRAVVRRCMARFNAWNEEWLKRLTQTQMEQAGRTLALLENLKR